MKDILYITYDGLLDPVGRSQVLPYLRGLSKKGFNISVISFEKKERIKTGKGLSGLKSALEKDGISWKPLRYHKFPALPATVFDIFSGYLSGLYKNDLRTVHARGYISALIGVLLKLTAGRRLIFDMRGFWPDEKVDGGAWGRKSLLYLLFKKIERLLVNSSDEVIVLSESAMRRLKINHPKSRITVIPCCVDIALFDAKPERNILPEKAKNRFVLIYSGSVGSFYDLEGMIVFFNYFKKIREDAFFWIATNSDTNEVEETVKKYGLDREDYEVNNLDFTDMPRALSASDMSIMFYKRNLSGAGCSPIKFAESLSCGLPVMINPGIGDTEEIIRKEGVGVVFDASAGSYEKASHEVLSLLAAKDALKKKCRAVAENYFSLSSGVNKYKEIYQRQ